jgi:hypothetical protein
LLLLALPAVHGQEAPTDTSGTTLRFANLLAYREEARVILDNAIVISNTVGGEISDYAPITPGQHRARVIPRYGKGELLSQDFIVKAGSKTTLVLTGGPAEIGQNAPSTVIPLVYEKPAQSAPTGPDAKETTCTMTFANGDLRGPIKVGLKGAGGESTSFDIAPGKMQTFDKFPIGSLDLAATPLFKLPTGDDASVALNAFSPDSPTTTYYCVFYSSRPNRPTRALFLSTTENGDLGKSVIMDTR